VGAASAYFLSKRGIGVEVIEAEAVACAASGKAGGFLALDWSDDHGNPVGPLSQLSFGLHEELAKEFGAETVGYRRMSAVAADLKTHKTEAEHADYLGGVTAERIIGTEKTCAQVHPKLITEAMMRASGAQVTIARVTDIEVQDNKVSQLLLDDDGRARKIGSEEAVIFALGPWSNLVSDKLGLPTFYGQKAHSMVVPTEKPLAPYAAFTSWKGNSPEVYPRTNEAYVCGYGDSPRLVTGPASAVAPTPRGAENLAKFAERIFHEAAENAEVRACNLPVTEDGIPIIGALSEFGAENAAIAAGHSCWGILNGPATGKIIAELLVDGRISSLPPWAVKLFSPDRHKVRQRTRRSRGL